jgi:hypothetical protein
MLEKYIQLPEDNSDAKEGVLKNLRKPGAELASAINDRVEDLIREGRNPKNIIETEEPYIDSETGETVTAVIHKITGMPIAEYRKINKDKRTDNGFQKHETIKDSGLQNKEPKNPISHKYGLIDYEYFGNPLTISNVFFEDGSNTLEFGINPYTNISVTPDTLTKQSAEKNPHIRHILREFDLTLPQKETVVFTSRPPRYTQ